MLDLKLAVCVLVDGQRVDDAHRVAFAEPLEFADDLAVEVRVAEPKTMSCTGPIAMSHSSAARYLL